MAQSEATNSRVLTKDDALNACRAAMSQLVDKMCGATSEATIYIPEGHEAEDVAVAVGGSIVAVGVVAGRRVVVVRLAVAMLTSSFVAESLPRAAFTIEQCSAPLAGLAKVSAAPVFTAPASFDYSPVAHEIKSVAPIVGDSILIKALSRSAAVVNVFASIFDFIQQARMSSDIVKQSDQRTQRACCDAGHDAMSKVWKTAAKKFHDAAYQTQTGVVRFYGRKPKRA